MANTVSHAYMSQVKNCRNGEIPRVADFDPEYASQSLEGLVETHYWAHFEESLIS